MSFDETMVTYREKTTEATFFSTRVRVPRITRGSILDPFSFRLASSLLESGLVRRVSLTIEYARIYEYYDRGRFRDFKRILHDRCTRRHRDSGAGSRSFSPSTLFLLTRIECHACLLRPVSHSI